MINKESINKEFYECRYKNSIKIKERLNCKQVIPFVKLLSVEICIISKLLY